MGILSNETMIDVHVLIHSETRREWLDRCLDSLAGQPVVVHVVKGIEGSVGAGRAKGFSLGSCDFVAYVDSDDYVLEGHFDKCLDALKKHRSVVPVERVFIGGDELKYSLRRFHNGAVYRRSDVEALIPAISAADYTCDLLLRRELLPKQLLHVGYAWRVHGQGAHKKINMNQLKLESKAWRKALLSKEVKKCR